MKQIVLHGQKLVGGKGEGDAIVSREAISFIGGVDPLTGIVTEKGHELEGKCIAGKVLVYPTAKGSTGAAYRIFEMRYRQTNPAAFIMQERESVTIVGCIMGDIPAVDRLNQNPVETIEDGDYVVVDADLGTVTINKKEK